MHTPEEPVVNPDVIEWLEFQFPDRLPDNLPVDSQAVARSMGIQHVVKHLRSLMERQTKPEE